MKISLSNTVSCNGIQSLYLSLDLQYLSEAEPDVILLQISGTVDSDLSNLTANEMMLWGLLNLWKEGQEGGYSVQHGRHPVNDL